MARRRVVWRAPGDSRGQSAAGSVTDGVLCPALGAVLAVGFTVGAGRFLVADEAVCLPHAKAFLAPEAQNMPVEARNLWLMTDERDWRRLILITNLFHTRRAGCTFRALLPETGIDVACVPNADHDRARRWRMRSSWASTGPGTAFLPFEGGR